MSYTRIRTTDSFLADAFILPANLGVALADLTVGETFQMVAGGLGIASHWAFSYINAQFLIEWK